MNKIRIIPTLLSDGKTLVKGEKFESWRSVGSLNAAARLFGMRDVDELMYLDVAATRENRSVSLSLIEDFASNLSIPFSVGGGIDSVDVAERYLRAGAEKIVIGTCAVSDPKLISTISNKFGSQAVVVSLDILDSKNGVVAFKSGTETIRLDLPKHVKFLEDLGTGELLVQSVLRDGTMIGMDSDTITQIASNTTIPVIASGGASCLLDFKKIIDSGASAVAAGAIFQFTQLTPRGVSKYLKDNGYQVRNS